MPVKEVRGVMPMTDTYVGEQMTHKKNHKGVILLLCKYVIRHLIDFKPF